jgi:hypothetical protein
MAPLGTLVALLALVPQPATSAAAEGRRLQRACDAGNPDACMDLGRMIWETEVSPRNRTLAAFRQGCDLGNGRSCTGAGSVLMQESVLDPSAALDFYRLGCERGDDQACHDIVDNFIQGGTKQLRFAASDDAARALSLLNDQCSSGTRRACFLLAEFSGKGVEGVMRPDPSRARFLSEQACRLGLQYSCRLAELLQAEPPTENTIDDVREALIRQRGFVETEGPGRGGYPLCLTFASEENLEGADPPAAFLDRFANGRGIRPGSWCREHEEGSILAVGPVRPKTWPPESGLAAWSIVYAWDGSVSAIGQQMLLKDGAWIPGGFGYKPQGFKVGAADHAEDRKRILAVLEPFMTAWNRGESVALLGIAGPPGLIPAATEARHREYTRLDTAPLDIAFPGQEGGCAYARVRLRLHGTFEPRPGILWPLEPWKQAGAVSSIDLRLRRTGGWWRAGRWRLELDEIAIRTPWSVVRVVY